jgi:ubiquinone/menaquinone biosynthesis C-methylase UbiE
MMHYLSHLAELGATNLHPHGSAATDRLIDCLDLRSGQQVLEIGCGTGETLVRVALARDVRVSGVDVLPEMLRAARGRLRLMRLQGRASAAEVRTGAPLPFPDVSYHRVFTESVLGFQDAVSARMLLAEVFRVLRPGGRYVANEAVWKPSVSDDVVASVYRTCLADFGLCQSSEQNWSLEDWLHAMRAAGFQIVSADRLAGCEANRGRPRGLLQTRLLPSRIFTAYYRIKTAFSPRLMRRRVTYRRRLRRHTGDGQLIEAHLFVLEKPPGTEASTTSGLQPASGPRSQR